MSRFPVAAALLLAFAPVAAAGPPPGCPPARYYVVLFGGQGDVLRPRTAHTWAAFVKAEEAPAGPRLDVCTISWLPASLDVRPSRLYPEPGVNLDLEQTFAFMTSERPVGPRRIAMWGPWETGPKLYEEAVAHRAVLEAGLIRYRVFDWFDCNPDVSHCIHAVTQLDPDWHRASQPCRGVGELGTTAAARALVTTGLVPDPSVTHDWLIPVLRLDRQGVVRRSVLGPVAHLLSR